MRRIILVVATMATFIVVPCFAQTPEPAPRYAVVRIADLDKSVTNVVMTAAELETLKAEIQTEAPLFGRALQAASDEWKKDETLRKKMFPSTALGARQATTVGSLYDSEEKAAAALKTLQGTKTMMASTRPPSKTQTEKDQLVAQAQDLVVEKLDALKAGSKPGGIEAASTNKIALKPGQTLDRKTAGKLQTPYHIAVPDNYNPEKPPPLLVVFSPGGDGRGMMNQVRGSANKVGWMVIGCDTLKNGMESEESIPIEKEFLQDLHTFVPYDPTRLYYGGFSGGASRAYDMTYLFRDKCAGILAFGGWLGGREAQGKPFQKNMAVAMLNGEGDQGARGWEDSDKEVLKHRHCQVKTFHFPGGHGVAPRELIDEAIAWMDEQAGVKGAKPKATGAVANVKQDAGAGKSK